MSRLDDKKERLVTIGVVLWVSFLSASLATMLFFATFDPLDLGDITTYPISIDRMSGYSMGFLLFWSLLIINSAVVVWLARRPSNTAD